MLAAPVSAADITSTHDDKHVLEHLQCIWTWFEVGLLVSWWLKEIEKDPTHHPACKASATRDSRRAHPAVVGED